MRRFLKAATFCCVGFLLASFLPALAMPEAVCVPWNPAEPGEPHHSYSGATTYLKGIARGDATEYRWTYGDGSPGMSWTPITDPYALEASHAYTGIVGQIFVATLYVRNGIGETASDTYKVKLLESTDLSIPEHLDVRIDMAIDEGLWWLHKKMTRTTFPPGSPGYEQPYGFWSESYTIDATSVSVDAFQLHKHYATGDYSSNPYVETVRRGLNYMLYKTYAYAISPQPAGDPDTNGNGIGVVINHTSNLTDSRQTYIGGIAMVTLASSRAGSLIAPVGGTGVYGRPIADIVQDMVDFFAWGQVDSGSGRGGWRYWANFNGSDMSTAQWPPLGMITAEENMGAIVPQFVRDELPYFLDYVYHDGCDSNHGGFGYSYDINYPNNTKAAAGIICLQFLHRPLDDPMMQGAMGFLYRHWNDSGAGWDYTQIHGNTYGMYGVMKAMRLPGDMDAYFDDDLPVGFTEITQYDCAVPGQTPNSFDWYYPTNAEPEEGLAHYIVRTQQADGSWDDVIGYNKVYNELATGWRLLILAPGVGVSKPVAEICDCDELAAEWNQDVALDGSCSYHPVEERSVVLYEWDLDCDGTYDMVGEQATWPGQPVDGFYCVALRVTDDNPDGAQRDVTTCDIWVHEPPHVPIADANGPYDGFVLTPTTLDACGSWDPNGDLDTYAWDLDGDGEFDDCFSTDPDCTCDWSCPELGEWGICVEVCDRGEGGFEVSCDTDCTTIDCDNHSPVADPGGPYAANPNGTITLDGTGSYDIDPGDMITYAWELNGDGMYDDCFDPTCPFTVGGVVDTVYDVCLKVTDSFGESDINCTTVTVIDCPPDPEPLSQGYWHRQCLGLSEAEGGIDPGREGRGPVDPTEPLFVEEQIPCADDALEDLGFYLMDTCEGMDAYPPSDMCEKATKQLTALILNVCSQRLLEGCPAELTAYGCSATTIGGAKDEIASLILAGDCDTANACAAAINEGYGLMIETRTNVGSSRTPESARPVSNADGTAVDPQPRGRQSQQGKRRPSSRER